VAAKVEMKWQQRQQCHNDNGTATVVTKVTATQWLNLLLFLSLLLSPLIEMPPLPPGCHQIYVAVPRLIVVESYCYWWLWLWPLLSPPQASMLLASFHVVVWNWAVMLFGASRFEIGTTTPSVVALDLKLISKRFQSKWQQSKAPEAMVRGRCCGSSSGGWYGQWWCCNGLLVGYTWNILLHSSQSQKISEKSSIFDNKNVEIT